MSVLSVPDDSPTKTSTIRLCLAGLGIFFVGLALRVGLLQAPPHFDELYHLLAAQGWLESGQFTILDGTYDRAAGFTLAVAALLDLTGHADLFTARLVPLAAGSLLPVLLFLWVHLRAGRAAAWITAFLMVFWPQGIVEAQFLRFYSAHVLFFAVGAILTFEALQRRGPARVLALLGAAGGLLVALHLQLTTIFGVAGILVWLAATEWLPRIWRHPARLMILGAGAAAIAAAAVLAWYTGVADRAWAIYRWVPLHAVEQRDSYPFYHYILKTRYGLLWLLLPVLTLVALFARPRLAAFCACVFAACFLAQSFGGMKAIRYLSYGTPFLFVLWAIALGTIFERAFLWLTDRIERLAPRLPARSISAGVLVALGLSGLVSQKFFDQSVQLATGALPSPRPDWTTLPDMAGDWADAPFVLTTDDLRTIALIGDFDVLFHESIFSELNPDGSFATDPRTGRTVIADVTALQQLLACQPEGLLIADTGWWRRKGFDAIVLPALARPGHRYQIRHNKTLVLVHWRGAGTGSCPVALPKAKPSSDQSQAAGRTGSP